MTNARTKSPRRTARETVLRVLYQAELNAEPVTAVIEEALDGFRGPSRAVSFVGALAKTVAERREDIDARIQAVSENWTLARMCSIDRNVLRAAVAELLAFPDTDARVIIDEAVSIAREFGTDDSGRFVNGLLDRLARELRAEEF